MKTVNQILMYVDLSLIGGIFIYGTTQLVFFGTNIMSPLLILAIIFLAIGACAHTVSYLMSL